MDFFKNLFGKSQSKEEPPEIYLIVAQTIEILFPKMDDQKIVSNCILELEKKGRYFRNPRLLLALLHYSNGKLEKLQISAAANQPHFWREEIDPIFPKMENADMG